MISSTILPTLPFDTARRFAAIIAELKELTLADDARVLDVGGHPGTLARVLGELFPRWSITTVDQIADELPGYQQATGASLPFADASFDVVVSSDTLEHVPPTERAAFIHEATRVSRGAVVIGAPFHHDAIAEAETALNRVHREATGGDHPWLGEHVANGLPHLDETVALFGSSRTQRLIPTAPLEDWLLWQWSALAQEINGALAEGWKSFNAHCSAAISGAPGEERTTNALCYRWIIVSHRQQDDDSPVNNAQLIAQHLRHPDAERLRALNLWWEQLVLALIRQQSADGSTLAQAIDARLRAANAHLEAENERLRRELERVAGSGAVGALRRLLGSKNP